MASIDTRTGTSVAAYFVTDSAAHDAIRDLKEAGFTSGQIGYARRGGDPTSANYGNTDSLRPEVDDAPATSIAGTTPAGTSTGTYVKPKPEGTWDKIKNFFEGGDVEPYADEQNRDSSISHEIRTRPMTNNASSLSAGEYRDPAYNGNAYSETVYDNYDARDLHGTFNELSFPETHSRYFSHRLGRSEGGAIVTVRADGREAEAAEILVRNGGDIGSEASTYDYAESADTTGLPDERLAGESQRIQLLGEVLRVHKDRISRGEVVIRKEVITEQQTIEVPITREELVVERVAGDGLTPVSGTVAAGNEIRIPLTEERASVGKDTVVREEVAVGKRPVEDVRTLNADVAHEELRVDDKTGTSKY